MSDDVPTDDPVEVVLDGFAHGGEAVGRLPDGRACFVAYGIPGERVTVAVTEQRRRWARGTVVDVLEPSPDRVTAPCPLFGPGLCGGCSTQHIAVDRQAELLGDVIVQQLRRIGGLEPPDGAVKVLSPHTPDGLGYRNRARFTVTDDGRLAFRRARSHDPIAVDDCPLLIPAARAALRDMADGWKRVSEVQLQVGTDGHAALAVTTTGRDARVPSPLPAAVHRRGTRSQPGREPRVRHQVAGHTLATGVTGFFQASTAAAELLAGLVRGHAAVGDGRHVVDCYAGVGLFSVVLAADGARVTAIESDAGACADARRNAGDLPVEVLQGDLTTAPVVPGPVDVVVLDPPRTGAGPAVTDWIAGLAPQRVVYVSCDPATFARDARALVDHGLRLEHLVGVDQFTHSGQVELVARFGRDA